MRKGKLVTSIFLFIIAIIAITNYTHKNHQDLKITNDNRINSAIHESVKPTNDSNVSLNKSIHPYRKFIDYVDDLKDAIRNHDEMAIQMAIETIISCSDCLKEMIETLNNASSGVELRLNAAKALIRSGIRENVLEVFKEAVKAHLQGDYELKESLLQILADVDSIEAADTLSAILSGGDLNVRGLPEVPDDLRYALGKAIRNVPNNVIMTESLASRYQISSQKEQQRLLSISYAPMDAILALEAYRNGDEKSANKFMNEIVAIDDIAAISGLILIAKDGTIPLDETANAAYEWVEKHPSIPSFDVLVEYLSNPHSTPEEKTIAVYGLTASNNDEQKSLYALEKAYRFENNLLVRDYIESALATFAK